MANCKFCNKELIASKDYYMVRDNIWAEVNLPDDVKLEVDKFYGSPNLYTSSDKRKLDYKIKKNLKGFVCLDCLEKRLGRELRIEDFKIEIPLTQYNTILQSKLYAQFLNEEEIETLNKYKKVQHKIIRKVMGK